MAKGGFNDWTSEQRSNAATAQWEDKDFRHRRQKLNRQQGKLVSSLWKDPEYKKRQTKSRKKAWTPERRAAHAARIRELWKDPEYAKKASAGFRKPKTEQHRKKIGDAHRGKRRPETSARQLGRRLSAETRSKISKINSDGRMIPPPDVLKRRNQAIRDAWTPKMREERGKRFALPWDTLTRRVRRANRHLVVTCRNYKNGNSKLKIHCTKCGTSWRESWRRMSSHLGKCFVCEPRRFGTSEKKVRETLTAITGWSFPTTRPSWLKGRGTQPLEIDGYNKEHKVAFEYQGEQHYLPIFGKKSLATTKRNDERKRLICFRRGVTLIRVPYWKRDSEAFLRKKLKAAGFIFPPL